MRRISSFEIRVDERHCLVLVARHQVPVEVEGRLDRRVPKVGGDSRSRRPRSAGSRRCGDTRVGLSARGQLGAMRSTRDSESGRRERLDRARAEHETALAPSHDFVLDEKVPERRDDRYAAAAGATLRLARLGVAAHASVNADQPTREVDVVPEECSKLAAAQPGVERADQSARSVLASAPEASSPSARRWTSRRWIFESFAPPSVGRT